MNKITDIADTRFNHGSPPQIIMTTTVQHEVAFYPEHILIVLQVMTSDSMAKMINTLGVIFNKDQFAECYSVNDLDEHGKQFIEDMNFFIESAKAREEKQP